MYRRALFCHMSWLPFDILAGYNHGWTLSTLQSYVCGPITFCPVQSSILVDITWCGAREQQILKFSLFSWNGSIISCRVHCHNSHSCWSASGTTYWTSDSQIPWTFYASCNGSSFWIPSVTLTLWETGWMLQKITEVKYLRNIHMTPYKLTVINNKIFHDLFGNRIFFLKYWSMDERVREDALHWRKPIDNIRFRYHWQVFYQ